jgi:hypothetical protein
MRIVTNAYKTPVATIADGNARSQRGALERRERAGVSIVTCTGVDGDQLI